MTDTQEAMRLMHSSDCAVHNEPAMPNGDCNCGAIQVAEQMREEFEKWWRSMYVDMIVYDHAKNTYDHLRACGIWKAWQVSAAQSAEKMARLEADADERLVNTVRIVELDYQQKLAAAELSNKQLREEFTELVKAVEFEVNEKGAGGFLLARLADAKYALAQPHQRRGREMSSKLHYAFTCPKCGFHGWGTSNCDKPFDQWFGHCNASGCGFSWHRETADHVYLKESA